jgi:hypothetical protein
MRYFARRNYSLLPSPSTGACLSADRVGRGKGKAGKQSDDIEKI